MREKESEGRRPDNRIKVFPLAVFLCFFLVCIACSGNKTMAASASGQEPGDFEGSIREEELEAQIREYYDAVSKGDTERAEMLAGTESRQREERNEVLRSSGMEAIDVLDLIIYPCEEYRIVVVSYEIKIEGIETKAPGAETLVAKRTDEGAFLLLFSVELEQELPEADREMIQQKIKEITENKDLLDFFQEVNQRYIEAREDFSLREWEENWLAEQSRAVQEEEIEPDSETEQENGGELQETQKATGSSAAAYVVKEGDCLWNIAGDMLGDSTKWDVIYEKNKDVIGEDPNYILPGMELQLP